MALELDPLSLVIQSGIGRILHFAGDSTKRSPSTSTCSRPTRVRAGCIDLALTRMATGDLPSARTSLARAEDLSGAVSTILLLRASAPSARDTRTRAGGSSTSCARGTSAATPASMTSRCWRRRSVNPIWRSSGCRRPAPAVPPSWRTWTSNPRWLRWCRILAAARCSSSTVSTRRPNARIHSC